MQKVPRIISFCFLMLSSLAAAAEDSSNYTWMSTPHQRQERLEQYQKFKDRQLPSEKYEPGLTHKPRSLIPPADPVCRKICLKNPNSDSCQNCRT